MQVRARDIQSGDTIKTSRGRGLVFFVDDRNGLTSLDVEYENGAHYRVTYKSRDWVERV